MKFNQKVFVLAVSLVLLPEYAFSQGGLNQRIDELSQQIATEMAEYQKTTIAVVEFTDLQGNVTDLGRFIAEELITRLFQTKQFKVIERQLLNKVLSEQDLSLTGIIDPTSAKELEKILGVDAIASGTITDLAQSLRVNARLISTETGEIFAVASTEIFKDESVMRLMAGVRQPAQRSSQPLKEIPKSEISVPRTSAKTQVGGFTFEAVGVERSGPTVTVDVLVVNNGKDQNVRFGLIGTRLIDERGYEYPVSRTGTKLGSKVSRNSTRLENLFVSSVPMRATLKFEDIPEASRQIVLLEIRWATEESRDYFGVHLRDIPIPQ